MDVGYSVVVIDDILTQRPSTPREPAGLAGSLLGSASNCRCASSGLCLPQRIHHRRFQLSHFGRHGRQAYRSEVPTIHGNLKRQPVSGQRPMAVPVEMPRPVMRSVPCPHGVMAEHDDADRRPVPGIPTTPAGAGSRPDGRKD